MYSAESSISYDYISIWSSSFNYIQTDELIYSYIRVPKYSIKVNISIFAQKNPFILLMRYNALPTLGKSIYYFYCYVN